ncbi:MAG: peptidoglycan amidohydrolase family protein [Aerococcus suis]|nr:peptidoglycan amidohydrolase family protein [Aerococcus suis]
MIFFTDRFFKTIAVADNDTEKGLLLLDDSLNTEIKTGTSLYTAKISKNYPTVESIDVGCYVFVPYYNERIVALEVMEVNESRDEKTIIAEDAGLDLLNEDVGPIKMKGTLAEFIRKTIGTDSGWVIGLDEIGNSRNLTLEYEGTTNTTKRIQEIAGRFDAEVSYSFEFDGNDVKRKLINFHKERGKDVGERLEIDRELKNIHRNISITDLATALRPIGKPHKETIKTTKTVTETVNVEKPGATTSSTTKTTNPKLKKLVGWFESRKGKVRYSMYSRMGPNSYDCSSAVHFAAKHAGLIPKNHFIGNTESMFKWKNKYVTEISRNDIRYGDIFISGREGASSGAAGHTGVVYDKNRIIHCTYGRNGIALTPINGYIGGPPTRWFRFKNTEPVTQTKGSNKAYWTNNDLTKHDLGFNLPGLSASQINNWIKASNPKSAFKGHGNVFIEAQKQSGLDARYILAHAALESAWGNSYYGRKHHNYFGIGAFDNNPDNAKKFGNSGLATGIIEGAKWISKNYYNSSYKQTTLYKMRHNGGVHQYATDPNWHTKIANIMKRSERYCKPVATKNGTVTTTKKVQKKITEDKEVERDTNLIGYEYDDGRFHVTENGLLCDREQGKVWSRHHKSGMGYIVKIYNSEATSQKTLFDESLRQLKKVNEPQVSYEIELNYLPEGVELGDWVRIIDHGYNPELYLDARLVELTQSTVNPEDSTAVFANFKEQQSGIETQLSDLKGQLQENAFNWDNQPYVMTIDSTSGNVFKDNVVETELMANVSRLGIDQTAMVDEFIWERQSQYPDKTIISDDEWNNSRESTASILPINNKDVDMEATFICTAMLDGTAIAVASYTIKDLTIGIYNQEEAPDNPNWGDVWKWDAGGGMHWSRIWKGDRWEDTVTKRDLEQLKLTPGPPGADGEDGLPGKPGEDGKTTYAHFAYADSEDGKIGFTLTATNGKKYIGFYYDQTKKDSKHPEDYRWTLINKDDGIPGKPGVGIVNSDVEYAISDNSNQHPNEGWSNTPPQLELNKYLWIKLNWHYSDDSQEQTYFSIPIDDTHSDNYDGVPGKDDEDIVKTDIEYAVSDAPYYGEDEIPYVPEPEQPTEQGFSTNNIVTNGESWAGSNNVNVATYTLSEIPRDGEIVKVVMKAKSRFSNSIELRAENQNGALLASYDLTNTNEEHEFTFTWKTSANKIVIVNTSSMEYERDTQISYFRLYRSANTSSRIAFRSMPMMARAMANEERKINWQKALPTVKPGDYLLIRITWTYTDDSQEYGYHSIKIEPAVLKGIPGKEDSEGKTPYFHIAYANSQDGQQGFSTKESQGKQYIGTLIDYNAKSSQNPSDYYWTSAGNVSNTYTWVKYADTINGDNMSDNSEGKKYIGLAYNKETMSESTNPSDYIWTLIDADLSEVISKIDDKVSQEEIDKLVSSIDEKADKVSVDELIEAQSNVESLIEQYPTPESLNNLAGQFSDVDAYTKHLENAMESNRLDGLERFKIIEENVGSGQKFMQAISQYLSYSEEGLVLGQEGNALKISIDNERISFLDSGKEVAYISGQMLYILSGVFLNSLSIGNHKIEKLNNSNKITTITWIGGS